MWSSTGGEFSVINQRYPLCNEKYLIEDLIDYPVCINGKKRALLSLPNDIDQKSAIEKALDLPEIQKWLEGTPAKKVIVVPGKMINVVV